MNPGSGASVKAVNGPGQVLQRQAIGLNIRIVNDIVHVVKMERTVETVSINEQQEKDQQRGRYDKGLENGKAPGRGLFVAPTAEGVVRCRRWRSVVRSRWELFFHTGSSSGKRLVREGTRPQEVWLLSAAGRVRAVSYPSGSRAGRIVPHIADAPQPAPFYHGSVIDATAAGPPALSCRIFFDFLGQCG
jgi:hypothetical protein